MLKYTHLKLELFLSDANIKTYAVKQHFNSSPLDKMTAIMADDIFNCIFLNENARIPVPMIPIDNKPALVQIMAWRRIGDKPLPGPHMTQFTDAYMRP